MHVPMIEIDREEARKRVKEFTARRRKKLTALDRALVKSYKALSKGLTLVDVNEAIKQGGQFDSNHCPKIALSRADLQTLFFEHSHSYANDPRGQLAGRFTAWIHARHSDSPIYQALRETDEAKQLGTHPASINQGLLIELEAGTLQKPEAKSIGAQRWFKRTYAATVPEVPFHLRPDDLSAYFILWEVPEWREAYYPTRAPADPLLLERIAHPIYVVIAQWDLTELEQKLLTAFRQRG